MKLLSHLKGLVERFGEPFIYLCTEYEGEPKCTSDEMKEPYWFDPKGRVADKVFENMFQPCKKSLKLLQGNELQKFSLLTNAENSDRIEEGSNLEG